MYERLPLDFIGVTEKFGSRQDPITKVSTYHYAVDLGWNKYQGEPIYAIYDCTVVLEEYDNNLGNYIVLMHDKDNKRIISRYLHMKNRSSLKRNDKVKRGQVIGYMGSTGYSTGTHLHFEYWICPKNYKYNYADRSKYAVNPLAYCYLFENQKVSAQSASLINKVVGNPQTKNKEKDQIKVVKEYLNCRVDASLKANILGYIDYGYYNILDKKVNDNYTWYKIDSNKWVADVDNSIEIYLKEKPQQNPENPCQNLEEENKILKEQISNQKKIIEELTKEQPSNNYNSFTSPKKDYYYILLNQGDTIYYPKLNQVENK